MLMEMGVDSFADRYDDVVLGEGSELAMVDNNGLYITNPNPDLIGKPVNLSLPQEGNNAQQGSVKMKTDKAEDVLATYQTFSTMDWKLVGTVPVKELVKDAKSIQNLTWITALIAAIMAVGIGFIVIMTIAQPLVKLRNLMTEGQAAI